VSAFAAAVLLSIAQPLAAQSAPAAGADAVDPVDVVAAPWLAESGAADLTDGLAARMGVPSASAGPDFVLDGLESRRWLVERAGVRLLAAPWSGTPIAALPLALFLDERIAVRGGPGPGELGDAALGGTLSLERASRRANAAAQAATEVRFGSTGRSRATLAAGSDGGLVTTDVAAFMAGDVSDVGAGARASGARGRVALQQSQRAQLALECDAMSLAVGGARQQRSSVRFDSTLSLQPGQALRFDIVRQGLSDRPGGGLAGSALDEISLRAGYLGQLVVDHQVDLALTGSIQSARRPLVTAAATTPSRVVAGVVASDDWRIRPKLRLRASTSLGFDDRVGGLVAGRVALRYEPARAVVLRGVVGTAQRAPTLQERGFVSGAWAGPALDETPTLRAERGQGYRLSAGLEPRPDTFARITLVRTDLADLIEPVAEGDAAARDWQRYHNIGQQHVQALAVDALALRLAGGLGVDLAYRWLFDARDDRTGHLLADRPEHLLNLLVRWEVAALGTQLFVRGRLVRERVSAATGELAPLASVDAGAQLALFDKVDIVLALENAAGASGRSVLPLPERAARVALRLRTGEW